MKLASLAIGLGFVVVVACGEEDDPASPSARGGAGQGGSSGSGKGGKAGSGGTDGGEAGEGSVVDGGAGASRAAAGAAAGGTAGAGGSGADGGHAGTGGPVSGAVSGLVRSGLTPVAGVAVVVDGQVTSTDAAGTFTVPDVDEEYQLILISTDANVVQVMDGMTTRSTTIQFAIGAAAERSATIAGQLTGSTGIPDTAAHDNQVAFVNDSSRALGGDFIGTGDDFYAMTASWGGAASQPGKLYALQADQSAGLVGYTGFAEKALTISDAGAFGNTDGSVAATNLALIDPDERTLNGTLTVPNGYTAGSSSVIVGPFGVSADVDAGAYSVLVPTGISVPVSLSLSASGAAHSSSVRRPVPSSGDLDVVLPEASTHVLPVAAATGVTTATAFNWTPPPAETVVFVTFAVGPWTIWRFSTATSTTIPDLSPYGVPLPAGASGTWSVTAEGPATTIEEVLAFEDRFWAQDASLTEAVITMSPTRAFTTAN